MTKVMEVKYEISQEQYEEIKTARKANRDKHIDRRLKVLELRCEGKSLNTIAQETGFHRSHVSNLIKKYSKDAFLRTMPSYPDRYVYGAVEPLTGELNCTKNGMGAPWRIGLWSATNSPGHVR